MLLDHLIVQGLDPFTMLKQHPTPSINPKLIVFYAVINWGRSLTSLKTNPLDQFISGLTIPTADNHPALTVS